MATLTEEQKALIVCGFATYMTPKQIAERFKEEFDAAIDIKQVRDWHPSKKNGAQSRKWKPLFDETRTRFLTEMGDIPIANQATRLRYLNQIVEQALERRNPKLAMEAMEQAAKECGGMFTNKREVAAKVDHVITDTHEMSPEERRNLLADRLVEALARRQGAAVVEDGATIQ